MNAISTKDMPRETWLKHRRSGIGASEIGAVLGLSEFKTPYQVYLDKTSEEVTDYSNKYTERGIAFEDVVAERYTALTGNKVKRDNKMRFHPDHPFLFCSLDRIIPSAENADGPGVLELKTVTMAAHKKWEQQIPLAYFAQLQQQMAVTGYKWAEIALLVVETAEVWPIHIDRDDAFIEKMIEIAKDFWFNHVVPLVPPPMAVPDFEKILAPKEEQVEADSEIAQHLFALRSLKEDAKLTEEKIKEAEEKVKGFMGDKAYLTVGGSIVATWKATTRKGYTVKDATFRTLRLKEAKEE